MRRSICNICIFVLIFRKEKGEKLVGRLASITPAQTLSDKAYAIIKEAIVTNELKPGELLIEEKLAIQLNISRTPIRSALKRLMMERLVVVSNKSIEVADISFSEMQNIMQVRKMIEPSVIHMLNGELTEKNIEELRQIQNHLKNNIQDKKYRNYVDLDAQFHMYFIEMLHNGYLTDLFQQLFTNYGRLTILSGTCKVYGEVASSEHDEMITALAQGDYDTAQKAVTEHIMGIYERYCQYWKKEPNKI